MAATRGPTEPESGIGASELRRDVSVWGSYMWGYADVGADIYTALGIVALAALGFTPLAFLFAGLVYAMVGLCYAELASAYPVAGGGQYFALRGLGDLSGFIAGAALLLDYTIDISLFTVVAFGYLNFFLPYLTFGHSIDAFTITIGPTRLAWLWLLETLAGIIGLIWLNYRGIKVSSAFNEVLGIVAIIGQSIIVVAGFLLVWKPELVVHQFFFNRPTLGQFAFGSSLAIISFVGLESISQVAQETRRPATIIPRTSIGLILSVLIFAIAFAFLSMGLIDAQQFRGHEGDPVALIAGKIPVIGIVAAPLTALIGGVIVYISANSGVVSASRLTYSMSQFHLLPSWFNKVHPKFRTPTRTIVVFSGVALVQTLFAFLTPGKPGSNAAIDLLTNLYAFGASSGYLLVFVSLIVLRFRDPYTPRPYKMPLNITIPYHGRRVDFPVLGVVGFLGVSTILFEVILTHDIGRIAGPGWVVLAVVLYILFRRSRGLPATGNVPRDWEAAQKRVLRDAEEFESLEEYELALAERDRAAGVAPPTTPPA
jgi:basic amino acid/polyamine antiporter, APA family